MDLQLSPFSLERQRYKWLAVFAGSCLLWITPVGLKAPKLLIFLSLPSAIAGFAYCATNANQLKELKGYNTKLGILLDELENYEFGLKEEALKEQLRNNYTSFFQTGLDELMEPIGTHVQKLLNSQNDERLNASAAMPFSRSSSDERYTVHALIASEASLLVRSMQGKGLGKAQIIEQLWGVKKGGGKLYRKASSEYDYLARLGR